MLGPASNPFDRDYVGKVSRAEFVGTDEQFERYDSDGDGFLPVSEAEAADQAFRAEVPRRPGGQTDDPEECVSKPYDATGKDLIETDPAGWVTFLGCPVPPAAARLVDADLSTVTAEADKVIRVDHPAPWLLHLELHANWDDEAPRRYLQYNAMLQRRHDLPVATVVVMLRPAGTLTGSWWVRPPIGRPWEFPYEVVRVWERPAADFLAGPLVVLPLALLADARPPDLPAVVTRMKDRLDREADRSLAARLWSAAYILMGVRHEQAVADTILSGVLQMEESVTYQAILRRGREEGRIGEARAILLRLGGKKFGAPTAEQKAKVEAATDVARIETLMDNVFETFTWDDLLKSI